MANKESSLSGLILSGQIAFSAITKKNRKLVWPHETNPWPCFSTFYKFKASTLTFTSSAKQNTVSQTT